METTTEFIKKYNHRTLQDDGCYVSRQFSNFQNAMKRELSRIATEIGANLVSFGKGHYEVSWFVERNGKYVYGNYGVIGRRTYVELTEIACYVRTARDARDFRGGSNVHCSFKDLPIKMDKLLNTEHIAV